MGEDPTDEEIRPGSGAGLGAQPDPGDIAGGTGMVERGEHRPDRRGDADEEDVAQPEQVEGELPG